MGEFVHGALTMGYVILALFFLRFWRAARERLFLLFALAFAVLATNRLLLSAQARSDEVGTPFYWIRLAAYLLILAAIIDKNLRGRRNGAPGTGA